MLDSGDSKARHSAAVDRALPAGEFLEAEGIALAGFIDGQKPAGDGGNHLCLAAHDPTRRARRGQRFKRQRLAERTDDLCWPELLILKQYPQTCLIIVDANPFKRLALKTF